MYLTYSFLSKLGIKIVYEQGTTFVEHWKWNVESSITTIDSLPSENLTVSKQYF